MTCEQLNVERPVVVGHSLGGVVAMVLAAQYPDLPAAVVMVDAPIAAIDGPPSASDPRRQMLDALKGPGYADGVRSFVDQRFLPTDDAERRARITRTMTAAPQHVFASAVEQVWSCDLPAAASACRVPTLYIQAAGARPELGRLSNQDAPNCLLWFCGSGYEPTRQDRLDAARREFTEETGLDISGEFSTSCPD